jgi:putative ABC transport system ATP-binding protein
LIPILNVQENITLPLDLDNRKVDKDKLNDMLDALGLSERKNHLPNELSGGQQQRTSIGRALITNPTIILADEPTGNLDSKNGYEVMQLLSQLNAEGTTVVMVTHSQRDASFASRVINLFDGHIVDSVEL